LEVLLLASRGEPQRDQASTPVEHSTVQPGTKGPRRHEPGRPRAFSWSTRTESCAASRP